ncbi:Cytochrome P450 4c3 [Eumeta japonica]|uniref:Cytochrome P450 4c3 n=1 Tax=Eumeta variegata TaxID=151549 RepID=A0A4C1XEJ1_EUMVA|nr:Cytochrome P450 4c3 [Eumeta japonica]
MLVVYLIISVISLLLFHDYLTRRSRKWKLLSKFPGDPTVPFFGNILQMGFDTDEYPKILSDMWKRHGKVNFKVMMGPEAWVILSHSSELSKPIERNAAMVPFFGNSVSTSEGDRWRSTRKLMIDSFQFKSLDKRLAVVNRNCDTLIAKLGEFDGKEPVDFYYYLKPHMLDSLCESLMGVKTNYLDNPGHEYIAASGKIVNYVTRHYFTHWKRIDTLFKLTEEYREMQNIIKTLRKNGYYIISERKKGLKKFIEEIKENNAALKGRELESHVKHTVESNGCMLDFLLMSTLPNGSPVPDDMIREEVDLVTFTGHYTTTMTMCHVLYNLAKYPDVQKRVYEEQNSVLSADFSRQPYNQELNDMKYLEAVIKETMRIIPTVPKIARQLKEDLQLEDGRVLPAGTEAVIYYEGIFFNSDVYPEPHKFNPERFFEPLHPYAFVPFSAGPRNCLGFRYAWMAMKATLSKLIRQYEFLEGGPGREPLFDYKLITESQNGIQLKIKSRRS